MLTDTELLNKTLFHEIIHHRLPWVVEQDWTWEVTAGDGHIVLRCSTKEEAEQVIARAKQVWDDYMVKDEATIDGWAVTDEDE